MTWGKVILSLTVLTGIFCQGLARADTTTGGAEQVSGAEASATTVGPPPPPVRNEPEPDRLTSCWSGLTAALDRQDFEKAEKAFQHLLRLREAEGVSVLEPWSLELVRRGEEQLAVRSIERAAVMARWALELSPRSAPVMFRSLRLVQKTGVRSLGQQVLTAFSALTEDRLFLLHLLTASAYPVAWALTIALFSIFLLTFAYWMKAPLRYVGLRCGYRVRAIIAPLVVLPLLAIPVWAGPLWAIVVWSLVLLLVLPDRRWMAFYAGALLVFWAALIPIRETLTSALEDSRLQVFTRVTSGAHAPSDHNALSALIRDNPPVPAFQYAYGQNLLKRGQLLEADHAFAAAALGWRSQGSEAEKWALAQRAALLFISGDTAQAEKIFSELESKGFDQPEFLLNFSKVLFDKTETAKSRAKLELVARSKPELVEFIRAREEQFGDKSYQAVAELPLPLWYTLDGLWAPPLKIQERIALAGNVLMEGAGLVGIGGLGVVLMLLFFARPTPRRVVRREILYPQPPKNSPIRLLVQLMPGGGLVRRGYCGGAVLLLSVVLLIAMPLLGWPGEAMGLFNYLPDFRPFFVAVLALCALGSIYLSWDLEEEGERQ